MIYIMDRRIHYHGLRERPHYEGILNYVQTEKPKPNYPFTEPQLHYDTTPM